MAATALCRHDFSTSAVLFYVDFGWVEFLGLCIRFSALLLYNCTCALFVWVDLTQCVDVSMTYHIFLVVNMRCLECISCEQNLCHCCALADAVFNVSGFGFRGYDDDGEPQWDLVSNVKVWGVEVMVYLNVNLLFMQWRNSAVSLFKNHWVLHAFKKKIQTFEFYRRFSHPQYSNELFRLHWTSRKL